MFLAQAFLAFLVLLLLAGSAAEQRDLPPAERVRYSLAATCAVRGSTATLPCSFTPTRPVVRVRWCVNHLICHGTTPSVYDSNTQRNNWRYLYLGDLEGNCTLEIHNIQKEDAATFRFRMEARNSDGHFTGIEGVTVEVVDGDPMSVQSSAPEHVSEGAAVTLSCASRCSFHKLAVRWHQDGHALPESGPALQLTATQSANYTCGLADRASTMSPPFRLNVERRRADGHFAATLGLSFGLLMALLLVVAIVMILVKRNRRRASRRHGKHAEKEPETCENVYSNTGAERGGPDGQEVAQSADDVSYAAVQFKPKASNRPAETKEDVVYSSVNAQQTGSDVIRPQK